MSLIMEPLNISKTSRTPEVAFNPERNSYRLAGRSIPEDSVAFYRTIIKWLENFETSFHFSDEVTFEFELEYFNTSSSKCLLDVFKLINKIHKSGKDVSIKWVYDEEDEDLMETGEDYADMLDVPFELEGIEI